VCETQDFTNLVPQGRLNLAQDASPGYINETDLVPEGLVWKWSSHRRSEAVPFVRNFPPPVNPLGSSANSHLRPRALHVQYLLHQKRGIPFKVVSRS
jgi:hypothetical protein